MSLKRKPTDSVIVEAKKAKHNTSITSFFGAPKSSPTSASSPTAKKKFDKDIWVAGLTAEQKQLLALEINTLHESWLPYLKDELTSSEFLNLKRFLKSEAQSGKKIFPPSEDVYSWSRHTPFDTVKVVILGQDPYHNVNQAHGLCFSVKPPTPAPPSLKNIYIAIKRDYPDFYAPPNKGGLLTQWAEQGVLMLNTCLTVEAHKANSHANKGWERFTKKVIDSVNKERRNGVVFLAWGKPAQGRCTHIDSKHLVLKAVHPSPLSAHHGFLDCGHFKKTNTWLLGKYGKSGVIDWNLNPDDTKVEKPQKIEQTKEGTEVEEIAEEAEKILAEAESKADAEEAKKIMAKAEKKADEAESKT